MERGARWHRRAPHPLYRPPGSPNKDVDRISCRPFAPTGGITIPLLTTTETKTFTIFLTDTNNNGPILDSVTLDAVRICTQ